MTDKIIIKKCDSCGLLCNRSFRNSSDSFDERKLYYRAVVMELSEDEKSESEGMEYSFCGNVCLSEYFE